MLRFIIGQENKQEFVLTVMEGAIMQARAAGNLQPFDDSVSQFRAYFNALEREAAVTRAADAATVA